VLLITFIHVGFRSSLIITLYVPGESAVKFGEACHGAPPFMVNSYVPAPPPTPEIVIVPSAAPKQVISVPAADQVRTGGWVSVILAVPVHPLESVTTTA